MSITVRARLLFVTLFALAAGQYLALHEWGHGEAFLADPAHVPRLSFLDSPLASLPVVIVALGGFLGLLGDEPIPIQSWTQPFDRAYRGQHIKHLCIAAMATIVLAFVFVLVRESNFLRDAYGWALLFLDAVLLLIACSYYWSWRDQERTAILAE